MGLGLNLNSGSSAEVILPSMCHLPALQMLPASQGPHRPPSAFQSLFQPGSCRHRKNQCPGREITPFTRGTKDSNLQSPRMGSAQHGVGEEAFQTMIRKFTKQQELLPHKEKCI